MEGGQTTVLAVVVGPGRLSAGLIDTQGAALVRDRIATPTREVWRSLEQLVLRVLAARPSEVAKPSIVAVSCSGPIDAAAGTVSPAAVESWEQFPLRQQLEALTGLPVLMDTLAGATAEAELRFGGTLGASTFFTLILDQAVESACVIDGVRLRGAHGNAGSLAHLTVDPGGRRCACGAAGCLAAFASAAALEAETNRPLVRVPSSIVERTGLMVGRAIASAAAAFDVSTFALSGAVVNTFGDAMLDVARREVAARSRLAHLRELRIVAGSGSVQSLSAAAAVALGGGTR